MVSAASGGTADRIAARILFKVLRAGSGTPARYSSTFFGAPLPFAIELRSPDFTLLMRAMLQELALQVHAPDRRAAVRHEACHSVLRHTFTCPRSRKLREQNIRREEDLLGELRIFWRPQLASALDRKSTRLNS